MYLSFIEMLHKFQQGELSVGQLSDLVTELFKGEHCDLLPEFFSFLGAGSEPVSNFFSFV